MQIKNQGRISHRHLIIQGILLITVILCLLFTGCVTFDSPKRLPTATSVDLSRYVGKWYELARLPMWAQRNCLRSTAEYRLLDSGNIGVRNACVTEDGERQSIEGVATIIDQEHHAKFNVVFDQWAAKLAAFFLSSEEGNYWILHVDPDYRYAVVVHQIESMYGFSPEHRIFQNPPIKISSCLVRGLALQLRILSVHRMSPNDDRSG